MKIKYNTWTGTYYVYRLNKPVQLRKDITPKMKLLMKNKAKSEGCFKIWNDERKEK